MPIVICLAIVSAPILAFFLSRGFAALPILKQALAGSTLLLILLLSQLNHAYERYYFGTDIHIPILWTLAYTLAWVLIYRIPKGRVKYVAGGSAAIFHVSLVVVAGMLGIWVIGDLSESTEVIFADDRVKAYQTGWGNFAHNGIDVHVVKLGMGLHKVVYHQRFEGPSPKDRAISIHSDDGFIYRILRENIEINTFPVP